VRTARGRVIAALIAACVAGLAVVDGAFAAVVESPVPPSVVEKIGAKAVYPYVPTVMVSGYKFRSWRAYEEGAGDVDWLEINFARGKKRVQWQVVPACCVGWPQFPRCNPPFDEGTVTRVIHGRRIHSLPSQGAGWDTWTCLRMPNHAAGSRATVRATRCGAVAGRTIRLPVRCTRLPPADGELREDPRRAGLPPAGRQDQLLVDLFSWKALRTIDAMRVVASAHRVR
jgi:hypothetical protein